MKNKTIDVSDWKFYLHSSGVLDYWKTKNGNPNHWKPKRGKHSQIPPFFFYNIMDKVIKAVDKLKKEHKKKTYKNMRRAITSALMSAATVNKFKVKPNSDYGDLVCRFPGKHGRRYIVFQICDQTNTLASGVKDEDLYQLLHDDATDVGERFRNMEHKSRSLLRFAWFIGKGGFLRGVKGLWRGEDDE